jgi:methyl coenzyme M reductase subunit C
VTGRELTREEIEAVLKLLATHPELTVDRLRELVEAPTATRRRLVEPVRPKTTGDVVELVATKIITRAEARRYLRLR